MRYDETYWNNLIHKSLEWKKSTSRMCDWGRIDGYYNHHFADSKSPHFNLIYMLASSLVPALVYQNPAIVNTPRRPDFTTWARFYDGIDNWLVDEMELKEILERAVLHAFLHNIVGLELNYDFGSDNFMDEMRFEPMEGCVDRTRKTNQPWLDLIPGRKLLLAPNTTTMRNCPFYGKNVTVSLDYLKKKKGLKNLSATHIPEEVKYVGEKTIQELDPDRQYMNLWIIREAEGKKWFWISSEGKFVLPPEEDPLQIDGLPLDVITFNRGINSIWGVPDASYIESQQVEGDESRRDGRLQSRGANLKAFYDVNLLDEADITKFITSDALGCIPVEVPTDKKLSDVILMVQPHVQMERFEYQKQLLNDAQLITGNGPNQFGTFAPGRRTKFEAQVVEERNILRTGHRRMTIAMAVEHIFGQINQLVMRNWKAPLVSKVIGADAALYYVRATPSELNDLEAQLVTTVNVESLAPTSRERRKNEMYEVMNSLAKLAPALGNINLFPIVQSFLAQFDWIDVTKILPIGSPTPMSMPEFQQQQQSIQQNPQFMQMLQGNLGGVQGLLPKYPQGGMTDAGGEETGR